MAEPHIEVWNRCLKVIEDNVNSQSFKTWFEPIEPLKLEGNVLTIQVPSQFFYEWLEEHYVHLLKKTIRKEIGHGAKLEYSIVMDNSNDSKKKHTMKVPQQQNKNDNSEIEVNMPKNVGQSIKNPFVIPGLKKTNIDSQLNPNFTMESFIEGDCNRLGRSAGQAVAEKPGGTSFNPLMVYGGVGLGKTHLIQAVGNEIMKNFKNKAVLYVSAERFTNQLIESIRDKTVNDFLNFYHLIDVLILDDVQFFGNKGKTQDIFFHIFNQLHQDGKQLVLSSDRPPKDLEGMEERLLSRFKWGLSADLTEPDFETRIAILQQKMHHDGIELPNDVIEYIAYHITSSIRELEGALISLLAHSSFNKRDVDLELAREVLQNFIKQSRKELSIEHIQNLVCDYFEVEADKIRSKTRKRHVVQARQISMFLSKNCTNSSLTKIGHHFGGRDHSTVIHACQTVKDLMDTDQTFRTTVDEIKRRINLDMG